MAIGRRGFLGLIASALVVDPERALWTPGKKLISIPKPVEAFSASDLDIVRYALGVIGVIAWDESPSATEQAACCHLLRRLRARRPPYPPTAPNLQILDMAIELAPRYQATPTVLLACHTYRGLLARPYGFR